MRDQMTYELTRDVDAHSQQRLVSPHLVATLFVQEKGCYSGLPGVDAWPKSRDARLYAGPWPVVAHPPCQRWGKMWFGQPLMVKRTGVRKKKGDDGGCFAAALAAVLACSEETDCPLRFSEREVNKDGHFICPNCGRLGQRMIEASPEQCDLTANAKSSHREQ